MNARLPIVAALSLGLASASAPASAQFGDLGSLGGLGSLGSGMLPGLTSSVGTSNAAGLLSYCVKRKLLGGADAKSVLGKLTGQPEITQSKKFAAGEQGTLVTKNGQFSLASVKDKVKGKACNLVLDRAGTLLGRSGSLIGK